LKFERGDGGSPVVPSAHPSSKFMMEPNSFPCMHTAPTSVGKKENLPGYHDMRNGLEVFNLLIKVFGLRFDTQMVELGFSVLETGERFS